LGTDVGSVEGDELELTGELGVPAPPWLLERPGGMRIRSRRWCGYSGGFGASGRRAGERGGREVVVEGGVDRDGEGSASTLRRLGGGVMACV
jgi:hypothetical protein